MDTIDSFIDDPRVADAVRNTASIRLAELCVQDGKRVLGPDDPLPRASDFAQCIHSLLVKYSGTANVNLASESKKGRRKVNIKQTTRLPRQAPPSDFTDQRHSVAVAHKIEEHSW